MMLEEKIAQIKKLKEALHPLLNEVLVENMEAIFKLNKQQLNDKGIYASGNKIKPPYAIRTKVIKQELKSPPQPIDRVTLKDTGDFQKSFFLEVKADRVEVNADDWKTQELTLKYVSGDDQIFGLTKEKLDQLREIIREPYLKKVREFYARS